MMGANASYPFTEKLTGTFFVVNGYWHLARANNVPSWGGQVAYKINPRWMIEGNGSRWATSIGHLLQALAIHF